MFGRLAILVSRVKGLPEPRAVPPRSTDQTKVREVARLVTSGSLYMAALAIPA